MNLKHGFLLSRLFPSILPNNAYSDAFILEHYLLFARWEVVMKIKLFQYYQYNFLIYYTPEVACGIYIVNSRIKVKNSRSGRVFLKNNTRPALFPAW